MSVLAVFAFSETSVAARRQVMRKVAELLLPEVAAEVPACRPLLLRDAGIEAAAVGPVRWQGSRREVVYRSHWLL